MLYVLFSLELLSWMVLFLLPLVKTFNYLIIQGYFLLLSIVGILWVPIFICAGLLLKMGIPPFQSWLIRVIGALTSSRFIFFSTLHKLVPILLLSKIIIFSFRLLFARIAILVTLRLVTNLFSLLLVLIFSSRVHVIWIVLGGNFCKGFLLFYWALYCIMVFLLVFSVRNLVFSKTYLTQRSYTRVLWLIISGIPPFLIFWLKVQVIFWILSTRRTIWRRLLILRGLFVLRAYFRSWHLTEFVLATVPKFWGTKMIFLLGLLPVW